MSDYVERIKQLEAEIAAKSARIGEMEHNLLILNQQMAANSIGVAIGAIDESGQVAVRDTNRRNLDRARSALKQVESECENIRREYAETEIEAYRKQGRQAAQTIAEGAAEALKSLDRVIQFIEKANEASAGLETQCTTLQHRHRAHPYVPFSLLHMQTEPVYRVREIIAGALQTAKESLQNT